LQFFTECSPTKQFAFWKPPSAPKPQAKISFRDFVGKVNPRFQFYKHCDLLCGVLDRVAAGEIKRLLVQLPPRHSKSEMVSRLFSAYFLSLFPEKFVAVNSYAADLAFTLSRAARENFIEGGGEIKLSASAVKHWETKQGGGFWAAGVGGPITGKGFSLGIIDDPVKNAQEAASEVIRAGHKEWYSSTFYTRGEPDAAIIVIQTRWHEDDLTGWLLECEAGENPECWHVVCLPALAEEVPAFPISCTVEKDFRSAGAALCPERYSAEKLGQLQSRLGEYFFGALYQQRPTAKTGSFFDTSKIEIVDATPVGGKRVRAWDKAATAGAGDYTAGVKLVKSPSGEIVIEDVVRGQWDTAARDRVIRQTAELDGRSVKIVGEQEPGSGGKDSAQWFLRLLSGFSVTVETASGAKVERADPFSSQVNAGNVKLLRGDWNKQFLDELRAFPMAKHDDQVDAAALAFNKLSEKAGGLIVF
jgi:predicted phage terminase large subunit-like protein